MVFPRPCRRMHDLNEHACFKETTAGNRIKPVAVAMVSIRKTAASQGHNGLVDGSDHADMKMPVRYLDGWVGSSMPRWVGTDFTGRCSTVMP